MDLSLLRDFGLALFIGVLVGIDREQRKHDPDFGGAGGLRTFILLAEAGAICAWLSVQGQVSGLFLLGALLVMALLLTGYGWHAQRAAGTPGVTTLVAGLVVYLLGGMVVLDSPQLAVALAIVTSAVLAYKESLHGLVGKIAREDLYSGIKLLAASCIVLPVVPNHPVDPWGALNPYKIWLLVVLISGLSLLGYVVSRFLGSEKGTPLTGLAGGLVSSTAVTLEFARRSRQEGVRRGATDALAAGVLLAWAVMVARVGVIVAAVYLPLLRALWPSLLLLGTVNTAIAVFWWRKATASARAAQGDPLPLKNPFNLTSAIKFAALFAVVLLLVKLVETGQSGSGFYWIAAVAGLTDVDALTLSMVEWARGGGVASVAVNAIVIAVLANTVCKAGIVAFLGAPALRRQVVLSALFIIMSAGLALCF